MPKYAVFTMDVESFADTECISRSSFKDTDLDLMDGFDEYIGLLDRYGIKSTLFTVGKFAPKIADRLKKCIASGHRLALHSYDHTAPMNMTPAQFRADTRFAKELIYDKFGVEVEGFRAPCFSMDKERLDILRELGFKYDSSHLDFSKARYTTELDLSGFDKLTDGVYKSGDFYEFGLAKENVFGMPFPISGGGYVRLSNWGFIKNLIWNHIRKNNYYVFYLHPFELTKQKIPFISDLKSYDKYYIRAGIKSYAFKVEQIIKMLTKCGYTFVTFEKLSQLMSVGAI